MTTQQKLTDQQLALRMRYSSDISVRAIQHAFERKPDPLASALREVRAEYLARGESAPW